MSKKNAYLGLFAAVAIIFGYVESLIPFFAGIPGIKLGLANLAVLFILQRYTWREAAFISFVRILVIGFLFGNLFSIAYSAAGTTLSLATMTFLIRRPGFSITGMSIAGEHHSQHRTAPDSHMHRGKFQSVLLCSGVPDLRSNDRYAIGILVAEASKRIP